MKTAFPVSSSREVRSSRPARLRAAARRRADGAIIFITAMTLALLASLGLYALSATRSEVKASGYMTRVNMTEGIQQWALSAAMASLNSGAAKMIGQAETPGPCTSPLTCSSYDSTKPLNNCQALANVPSTETAQAKACLNMPLAVYTSTSGSQGSAAPIMWSTPGRTYQANVDLFTEMTNADEPLTQPAGYGQGTTAFRLVTLTTYGILHMHMGTSTGTSANIVHQGRGHLIVGPIPCNSSTPC
jgi:hypothetical protein